MISSSIKDRESAIRDVKCKLGIVLDRLRGESPESIVGGQTGCGDISMLSEMDCSLGTMHTDLEEIFTQLKELNELI